MCLMVAKHARSVGPQPSGAFKVVAFGPDSTRMPPEQPCPVCGAVAQRQGFAESDPGIEIIACADCGEFWTQPAAQT